MSHHQPPAIIFFQFSDTKILEGFSEEIGKIVEFTPEQTIFFPKLSQIFPKNKNICGKTFTDHSPTKFVVFPRKKLGKFWNLLLFSSVNSTYYSIFWKQI